MPVSGIKIKRHLNFQNPDECSVSFKRDKEQGFSCVCHSLHHCVSKATGLPERPGEFVLLINCVIRSSSCPSTAFESKNNMDCVCVFLKCL